MRTLVAAWPAWLRLAALVGVSALTRFLVALATPAPWILPDEWIYSGLARSFAESGSFSVWDVGWPVRGTGPLYPVLISPVYVLSGSLEHAYVAVKAINALVMSLAAVPAYLLARRVVAERAAFFVAALTLLVPAMVYTSKVMTENVAYPLFLATALAIIRVLEKPTTPRQATVWGLLVLGVLARAEMVVLVLVYCSALGLSALMESRAEPASPFVPAVRRRLAAYRSTWLVGAGAAAFVVVALAASGRPPTSLFGIYHDLPGKIELLAVPKWLVYALAELDLATGVVPFAAFLLVGTLALRGGLVGSPLRRFAAVAVPSFAWFMVLGAAYATQPRPAPHVFERYVFYVMPFLFIALAYWIERGLPRPPRFAYAAAAAAALLPAALPFGTLVNGREWGVSSSTPGLVPWATLAEAIGNGWAMTAAAVLVSAALAALFLRLGPDRSDLLRFAVVCSLWLVTLAVATADLSASRVAASRAGTHHAWVDQAVGKRAVVAAVWSGRGERGLYALAEASFFNTSVRRFYHMDKPVGRGAPSRPLPRATPSGVDYLLVERGAAPGTVVASQPGGPLILLRIPPDGE